MNKKLFIFVFISMSISLIGIIVVQLYWINNAIEIEEQKFDTNVNSALNNAVEKIQKKNDFFFVRNRLHKIETDSMIIIEKHQDSIHQLVTININDEAMQSVIFLSENITTDSSLLWKEKEENIFIKKTNLPNKPTRINKNIQFTYNSNNQARIIQKKVTHLNNVINEMIVEYSITKKPIEKRISKHLVEETIEKELYNKSIILDFEYGIYEKNTPNKKMKSKQFAPTRSSTLYEINLFPEDILYENNSLKVYFPEKNNHIYRSLSVMMGASLLFTIGILVTFAITIFIILKQKKISKIKTDFINNMTHEFKTPIATISLAADSINNPKVLHQEERIKYFTSIIKEENKRMNAQVESVLQMSLLEKKDFEMKIEKLELHTLIRQAIKNISLQVERKGGKIEANLLATNDLALIDEIHFSNIVQNLLDNANKYSKKTPEITVRTENKNNELHIYFADNGIGMSKEAQSKIFDKFYRVSTGNIHNVKGFGLGLSYVKAIVMAFDGTISVKSELNKGSVFCISIPYIK